MSRPAPSMLSIVLALSALVVAGRAGAQSFERFHPDQHFSRLAVEQAERGDLAAAVTSFQRAARYAEKGSQIALALAYWNGEGVAVDRPRAYAWADLAAERGYKAFLAVREQMWADLDEAERELALAVGKELASEYADEVAKPRINRLLHQGLRRKTGTRTGSGTVTTGTANIDSSARASMIAAMNTAMANNVPAAPGGAEYFPGARMVVFATAMRSVQAWTAPGYYADSNWRPKEYWKTQDELWKDVPKGFVTVAPLRRED